MKAIRDIWLIQIEITNVCDHLCANCTRFVGHHRKPYFMELSMVAEAIDSLEGFPGKIGIMGGEPTLHPQFKEICALVQEKIPRGRRGLWTSGYKWNVYKDIIQRTFGDNVLYNDHTGKEQNHQPMLIAIDEVIDDKEFMWQLIDKCWVQERWSASITPKGGFFCEVAAAMDQLFEGPGGFSIEKGWWNKTPEQFQDQVKQYCPRCSGSLPLPSQSTTTNDLISTGNFKELVGLKSPKILSKRKIEVIDKKYTKEQILDFMKDWKPWEYLGSDGVRSSKELYGLIGVSSLRTFRGKVRKKIKKNYKKLKENLSRFLTWSK